jgi:hypothetical protein
LQHSAAQLLPYRRAIDAGSPRNRCTIATYSPLDFAWRSWQSFHYAEQLLHDCRAIAAHLPRICDARSIAAQLHNDFEAIA